jgi:hypothetical protein
MQLEELQAIWETQTERPVFSVNDFGLHLALYQVRERARRRLFWGGYFPGFVCSLIGLVVLLVLFVAFQAGTMLDERSGVLKCEATRSGLFHDFTKEDQRLLTGKRLRDLPFTPDRVMKVLA